MARKRKESLEGQIHVDLQPEELLQLKNICTIRMENNLEGFCRKLILEGLKREATDILSFVALSYRLEQDLLQPPSKRQGTLADQYPNTLLLGRRRTSATGLIKLDPPELDDKGLRGGEADEESLQKAQGTERANMQSALQGLIAAVPDQPQTNPTSVRPQGSKNTIA